MEYENNPPEKHRKILIINAYGITSKVIISSDGLSLSKMIV